MSTKAKALKAVTKSGILQKASNSAATVITKTDASQTLRDAATNLITLCGYYNDSVDNFNNLVNDSVTKTAAANDDLSVVKYSFLEFKRVAKGLVLLGITPASDVAHIIMY